MTDSTPPYTPPPPPPPSYVPAGPTQDVPQGGPTQYAPPPAPPPSRRGQWIRLAIVVGIAAAIGIGFFVFRDRVSNDVASLQPGECFDQPAAGETAVTDVQRQPCNEPHDSEAFANVSHGAAAGAEYPGAFEFGDLAQNECVPRLVTYAGLTLAQLDERGLAYGYFYPTRDSWASGDRVVMCYILKADDSKMTGTLRAAGGASPSP